MTRQLSLLAVETEKAGHCDMGKPISWPCDGVTAAFMKSSITYNDEMNLKDV